MGLNEYINTVNGINTWIEEHKDKDDGRDPNLYQMVDCLVDYGRMAFENPGLDMSEAKAAIEKMFELRESHPAFEDELIKGYTDFIKEVVFDRKYIVPVKEEDAAIKKFILTKAAGVYFYIWQTKQNDKNYKYDGVGEFKGLKDSIELYKATCIPQFGVLLDGMVAGIDENYIYSENKENSKHM